MTRRCHVTSGLISSMFDAFVAAGMTSIDYKTWLADKLEVRKENANPKSTKNLQEKYKNYLSEQSLEFKIS